MHRVPSNNHMATGLNVNVDKDRHKNANLRKFISIKESAWLILMK